MRIRSIKPEFWASQSNGRISRNARLVFIGLISAADNFGRFRADPRKLAADILPYDRDGLAIVKKSLAELESEAKIELYTFERSQFGVISSFLEHQWMKRRGSPVYPGPRDPGAILNAQWSRAGHDPDKDQLDQGSGVRDQGSGDKGQGLGSDRSQPDPDQPKTEREPSDHELLFRTFNTRRLAVIEQLGMGPAEALKIGPAYINAIGVKWRAWFEANTTISTDPDDHRLIDLLLGLIDAYLADPYWGEKTPPWPWQGIASDKVWQRIAKRLIEENPA